MRARAGGRAGAERSSEGGAGREEGSRDREGRREEKKGNFLKMRAKGANQGDRMERNGRQHHPKHQTRPLPPARAAPTYEHLHLLAAGASESEPAPQS